MNIKNIGKDDWHGIANSLGFYAVTGWCIDDVKNHIEYCLLNAKETLEIVDDTWLENFLIENEKYIVDAMVEAGWQAIDNLLHMDLHDKLPE